MENTYRDLSAYSGTFGLELSLRNEGKSLKIGDLTTNPTGDRYRTSEVIGINDTIAPSSELFFQIYPEILKSTQKLELILTGGSVIELARLGTWQKFKDALKVSPLLKYLDGFPEGKAVALDQRTLTELGIKRGLTSDRNGYKQGFGKHTDEYIQRRYFTK